VTAGLVPQIIEGDGGARLPLKLVALALNERLLEDGELYQVAYSIAAPCAVCAFLAT